MQLDLTSIALQLLQDEANGDVVSAKEKMDLDSYSMTWMYQTKDSLFPSVSGDSLKGEMEDIYEITGREYEIVHTAQNQNVVFIEMIESYPDTESGKVYRTPITLVLEFKDGKVVRGRHYCDPKLSLESLSKQQIHSAVGATPQQIIKSKQ